MRAQFETATSQRTGRPAELAAPYELTPERVAAGRQFVLSCIRPRSYDRENIKLMMKRKENRLFRRARGFKPHRALKPAAPRFREYSWAYREAARALFEATSSKLDSSAAFPLVFLYRQAIELLLKFILIELGWNWGIQRQQVVARKHNLVDQLADVERMAKTIGAKVSRELKEYVGQFNGIDPKADAFRFPEHRGGKRALTEKEESFDVDQFVSRVERVLDELGELADELDDAVFQAILQEGGPQ